eukprot:g1836.t1
MNTIECAFFLVECVKFHEKPDYLLPKEMEVGDRKAYEEEQARHVVTNMCQSSKLGLDGRGVLTSYVSPSGCTSGQSYKEAQIKMSAMQNLALWMLCVFDRTGLLSRVLHCLHWSNLLQRDMCCRFLAIHSPSSGRK